MHTTELTAALGSLFAELVNGAGEGGGAFILNSGDAGLLRSLDRISAVDASQSVHGGATMAAHVKHVQYGLSLMNRWAREGGNPFADASWDAAWTISAVGAGAWDEIRSGLAHETSAWLEILRTPREVEEVELTGLIATIAHLAYHLGAIRQIGKQTRGPREGTFAVEASSKDGEGPGGPAMGGAVPILFVRDVAAAAAFYERALGFQVEFLHGTPPFYGSVSRDSACLHLRFVHQPNFSELAGREESLILATIEVGNVKALFQEYEARGVDLPQRLVAQPWGGLDFHVRDPDGNVVSFVQYSSPAR